VKPILFLPAFIFLIISAILLCMPGNAHFPGSWWFRNIPQFDKLVHIGLFGTLCLLFHLPAWKSTLSNRKRQRWFWFISIATVSYGVAIEFIQRELIVGRSFEEADILADTVGSLGALALSLSFFLRKQD
jgi:VanZ family protein